MDIKKTLIIATFLILGDIEMSNAQPVLTLIANPEVLIIPISDNKEPLIDLKEQAIIAYGSSPEIPNNRVYTKLRKSVYDKLCEAQSLLPDGLRFCIYEAYRSLSLQKILFENRFKKLRALHPDWTNDEVFDETIKMVSPVINKNGSQNIPPHSTGGAIDIYLIDENNHPVDMGIHPKDWMQDTAGIISATNSEKISYKAQEYRRVMSSVLNYVGFINYPTEYWHWSYGDRYWAHATRQPFAIYGGVYS